MPIYAYLCRDCGATRESTARVAAVSCSCGGQLTRDYRSVQVGRSSFREHFNHSIGRRVTSSRDFDEKLKIAGEAAGSTYARIDPGDMPQPSTATEAFDTQAKTLRDKGFTDSSGRLVKPLP